MLPQGGTLPRVELLTAPVRRPEEKLIRPDMLWAQGIKECAQYQEL